jgi:hypothetical protein
LETDREGYPAQLDPPIGKTVDFLQLNPIIPQSPKYSAAALRAQVKR